MTAPAQAAGQVLGVDPGLRVTGWGVLDARTGAAVACGAIRPPTDAAIAVRLHALYVALLDVIARHKPVVMAIERPFVQRNVRSAMAIAQAQAAAMLAGATAGIPVHEYAPREVKQAVSGDGNATKAALAQALCLRLHLPAPPTPADAADALAVALTHHLLGGALR